MIFFQADQKHAGDIFFAKYPLIEIKRGIWLPIFLPLLSDYSMLTPSEQLHNHGLQIDKHYP